MSYLIQSYNKTNEGLGSQMCDYASLYATSLKTGHKPAICIEDKTEYSAINFFNKNLDCPKTPEECFPNFNKVFDKIYCKNYRFDNYIISVEGSSFPAENYVTLGELYNYLNPNINYNLLGRFIPKYWYYSYLNEIKKLYTFDQSVVDYAKELLPQTNKQITAISMRYEYIKNHSNKYLNRLPQCRLKFKYYYDAMSKFPIRDTLFLVFADFPEHNDVLSEGIKKYLPEYTEVIFLSKLSSPVGICLMSMCDNFILSNSTFSWWGALLNNNANAKIICPKYFIDPKNCYHPINCHYYPDNWIPIKNN